jgi:hypothetical protein
MSTSTCEPLGYGRVKRKLPDYARADHRGPVANFLGMFSLGLGIAELFGGRLMTRATGVRNASLLRGYGAREIVSGLGILRSDQPTFWLWSRVFGDAIDLGTLAAFYARAGEKDRRRIVAAATAVAGVTVLDFLCASEHSCSNN